jgi:post-segregation antitoxin (ccd killing protein)
MKTKLTVTIDADLVLRAKQYARMQGVSLSQLIETALREACAEARPTFSQRWRGKFQAAQRGDERYQQLARKYL